MESYKYIKSTFLRLTSKTYPHGYEDDLVREMTQIGLFPNLSQDEYGNYYYKVGNSRTMFTSHLDTACALQDDVKHIISEQQYISTDGTTILGADDKAGVTLLLWMIKNNIPGVYYFFIGEEVGCVGSSAASTLGNFKGIYDRCISFDRRGTNSVITFQYSNRTCSDLFAKSLSSQLNLKTNFNYRPDDTGVYTDSAEFAGIIPECTNISVGYYNEHSVKEYQDLYHLNKLANAILDVDWESLPVSRDPNKTESKWEKDIREVKWFSGDTIKELKKNSYFEDEIFSGSSDLKSNKRKRRKTGKKYYDSSVDGLLPVDKYISKLPEGSLDLLKEKFLTSDISTKEMRLVTDQYLVDENIVIL